MSRQVLPLIAKEDQMDIILQHMRSGEKIDVYFEDGTVKKGTIRKRTKKYKGQGGPIEKDELVIDVDMVD